MLRAKSIVFSGNEIEFSQVNEANLSSVDGTSLTTPAAFSGGGGGFMSARRMSGGGGAGGGATGRGGGGGAGGGASPNTDDNRSQIINALTEAGVTDQRAHANILGIIQSESGMRPQSENMNYRDPERMVQLFPSRVRSVEEARRIISGGPEAIANALYGGEWGARNLGNTEQGDGWKYRGRGYNQLTGRANYAAASRALGVDLIGNPDLANDPAVAARLIPWYYLQNRGLSIAQLSNMDAVIRATGNTTADMRESRYRNAEAQHARLTGGGGQAAAVTPATGGGGGGAAAPAGGSAPRPVEGSAGTGAQVAQASQENAIADRTPAAPSVTTVGGESSNPQQGDPGVGAPGYFSSPNDPGNVEPEDAAERYARLFNMAA